MKPKPFQPSPAAYLRFYVSAPSGLAAGLHGFDDTVTLSCVSGQWGGAPGEFEGYMRKCLADWYDGASVMLGVESTTASTSPQSKSLKLYRASGYPLSSIPSKYRAANGSNQVNVLARCRTKRAFATILAQHGMSRVVESRDVNSTYHQLITHGLCQQVTPDFPQWNRLNAVAVKDNTIYYNPQHHCGELGYVDEWFEAPTRS